MKLSVIIASYNSEANIERCLNSILNQTFENYECIIIDDRSTDNSLNICKKFASFDCRFKVVSKYHTGQAISRNIGIQAATGEYICFIDTNIQLHKNCFEQAVIEIDKNKQNILQFNYNLNGKEINCKFDEYEPEKIKNIWNKIYRTSFIKANNINFKDCSILEDLLFNNDCYEYNSQVFSFLDKCLCTYYPNKDKKISSADRTSLFIAVNNLSENDVFNKYIESFLDKYDTNVDYIIDYSQCIDKINLQYKLRAIEKWMPWIGTIHILINNEEIPYWLNSSKVNIVKYRDFIPNEYLPTNNSKVAEIFCFNIKGLSSKFIFSNDHCIPNFTLKDSDFYTEDYNSVKLKFNIYDFSSTQVSNFYRITLMNDLSLASKGINNDEFDLDMNLYEIQYTDKPLIKRHCIEAFENNKDILINSLSKEREAKNVSINFYSEYSYLHYKGENTIFKHSIINADESPDYVYRAITMKRLELRDKYIALRVKENYSDVNSILASYYKEKSKYEN